MLQLTLTCDVNNFVKFTAWFTNNIPYIRKVYTSARKNNKPE